MVIARDCCVRFPLPHSTLKAQGFHGPKRKKTWQGLQSKECQFSSWVFSPKGQA